MLISLIYIKGKICYYEDIIFVYQVFDIFNFFLFFDLLEDVIFEINFKDFIVLDV